MLTGDFWHNEAQQLAPGVLQLTIRICLPWGVSQEPLCSEPGLNYLCEGYHRFFDHAAPYMDFMKKEYLAERAPANVMEWARSRR